MPAINIMKNVDKLSADEMLEFHKFLRNLYIDKKIKEYDDEIFPQKNPLDKIRCKICNGFYSRRSKWQHEKGEKHQTKLSDIIKNKEKLSMWVMSF